MHKIISIVISTAFITACSENPKHFSCKPEFPEGDVSSLSIKNDVAVFNAATFDGICRKNGNVLVYGKDKKNCENFMDPKDAKPYEVLVFDEVIYRAVIANSFDGRRQISDHYACTKLN